MDLTTIDLTDLEALQKLQRALNELGQPDKDEGARLHAEKNAPSVSGIYSHLKFPPYTFKPYPRALYSPEYPKAKEAFDRAVMIPARGTDTGARDMEITLAQRALNVCTKTVHTEEQYAEARGAGWCDSPMAAVAAKEQADRGIAQSAAESNYDDRNIGEKAKAEREAIDDEHDGHLVEIPAPKKRGPSTRVVLD